MESWSSLKDAMDKISTEVRQVLLVGSDVSLLQKDLFGQEDLWRKAEADLQTEISGLEARSAALHGQVQLGAHLEGDVEELKKSLQEERGVTAEVRAAFAHEENQATLEAQRLTTRVRQLQLRLEELNRTGTIEVQQARDRELQARQHAAELDRQASAARDSLADNLAQLASERDTAVAKAAALRSELSSLNATWEHQSSRLLPRPMVEAQLASMKIELEAETKAIIQAQTAMIQLQAKCRGELQKIQSTLTEEQFKADQLRNQMIPFCEQASSQREVLQKLIAETCNGTAANALGGSPGAFSSPEAWSATAAGN